MARIISLISAPLELRLPYHHLSIYRYYYYHHTVLPLLVFEFYCSRTIFQHSSSELNNDYNDYIQQWRIQRDEPVLLGFDGPTRSLSIH